MKQLQVTKNALGKLKSRFCWVYRNEVHAADEGIENGDIVEITDRNGAFLAVGYVNFQSEITVRVLSLWKLT